MSTDRPADAPSVIDSSWGQHLLVALRGRGVPANRIGELLAEVDSHVRETGEDPAEAFGTPREYAAALTHEHRRVRWAPQLLEALSGAAAGLLVFLGAFDLLQGEDRGGLPWWVLIGLGLLLGVPGGRRIAGRARQVHDPRTGTPVTPSAPRVVLVIVVVLVLAAFAVAGLVVALT